MLTKLEFDAELEKVRQEMQQGTTAASSATAASSTTADDLFSSIDTNGDGSISADELSTFLASATGDSTGADEFLASLDTDGDGSISASEFEAGAPPPPPGSSSTTTGLDDLFSSIDTNGDGSISSDELTAFLATDSDDSTSIDQLLAALDTDGNGSVSESEFEAGATGSSGGVGAVAGGGGGDGDRIYDSMDLNHDGTVTADELAQFVARGPEDGPTADELLAKFDTDGDGSITKTEFETAWNAQTTTTTTSAASQTSSTDSITQTASAAASTDGSSSSSDSTDTTSSTSSINELLAAALRSYSAAVFVNFQCRSSENTLRESVCLMVFSPEYGRRDTLSAALRNVLSKPIGIQARRRLPLGMPEAGTPGTRPDTGFRRRDEPKRDTHMPGIVPGKSLSLSERE